MSMRAIVSFEQGGAHKTKGKACEDRAFAMESGGVQVISLCDGAGNQRYTHAAEGADCTSRQIAAFLCSFFDRIWETADEDEIKKQIVLSCQDALRSLAAHLKLDSVEALSSTMLAAAKKGDHLFLCHIGDGVIGCVDEEGTTVLSAPENGEFASTTYFITMPDAAKHVRIRKLDVRGLRAVFLMSDGTSDYCYHEDTCSFVDGVKHMAAMVLEKDGSEQLARTIREFMTDADPQSDDCSFAVMSLDDAASWKFSEKKDVKKKQDFEKDGGSSGKTAETGEDNKAETDRESGQQEKREQKEKAGQEKTGQEKAREEKQGIKQDKKQKNGQSVKHGTEEKKKQKTRKNSEKKKKTKRGFSSRFTSNEKILLGLILACILLVLNMIRMASVRTDETDPSRIYEDTNAEVIRRILEKPEDSGPGLVRVPETEEKNDMTGHAETESETETETKTEKFTETETEKVTETETEKVTETETEKLPEAETDLESESEALTEPGKNPATKPDILPKSQSGKTMRPETESETETESGTETESEMETEKKPEKDEKQKPDTDPDQEKEKDLWKRFA